MKTYLPTALLMLCFLLGCKAQSPVLWGMTSVGGVYNSGTIFFYDVERNIYEKVYDFGNGKDGVSPWGNLIQANNGLLYGMTTEGGIYSGGGTLFSYNIVTGEETVIHSFGAPSDGAAPLGSLIQGTDGLLYGMTTLGGVSGKNYGVIFSYNIASNTYKVMHAFENTSEGTNPYGSLIQASNGLLYGTTLNGSLPLHGTLFSYNISNGDYNVVHTFGAGGDGIGSEGGLVQGEDNTLYGITGYGGMYDQGSEEDGGGVIFAYDILTNTYNIVHDFAKDSDGSSGIGALMLDKSGILYGMTRAGGTKSLNLSLSGTIFSFDPVNKTETVLHSFSINDGGITPTGSPIRAINGPLYGMTSAGGVNVDLGEGAIRVGKGLIFKFDPSDDSYTDLHDFILAGDGATPLGSLLEIDTPNLFPQPSNSYLQIFPNPTTGIFRIMLPDTQSLYTVEVFDILGKKIQEVNLSAYQNTINLNNLSDGIYLIYLITEKGKLSTKVIVAR